MSKKLKEEINKLRKEQNLTLLSQDQLDNLTIADLKEEVKMLKIYPNVKDLFEKTQRVVARLKDQKEQNQPKDKKKT